MPVPHPVNVHREVVVLPTYAPDRPDPNPMFLEKRVYQGSSGRVYPLPFTDRITENPVPRSWDAVFIENEFIRVMLLPQLGGRIHRIQDKTNGYDAIYYQPVIKPALVGLAGPWCSGGIEFNWPQHHRPSTFMPADVVIEHDDDGSATVWLGEHDPMARMKAMHGVRLSPGRSYLELVARVYNRTADTQTFLWWANVAIQVHEGYQSFFPPDVTHVADHAKRATSAFPICRDRYYGVDYANRGRNGVSPGEVPRQFVPPHCLAKSVGEKPASNVPLYRPDDLSWYANIPVPTSYMCMGSSEDFFGGYDHKAQAGLIHVANHHISPGKKQWTWGNHEFGYAWDRNLTDANDRGEHPPYIELMAGVFTDNQPDFSFLQPGETKTWRQYWYPIRAIGPAQKANVDAALSLTVVQDVARIGIAVTAVYPQATLRLERSGKMIGEWTHPLAPHRPLVFEVALAKNISADELTLRVLVGGQRELIAYSPHQVRPTDAPPPATEPPSPAETTSSDELFVIGTHLELYRHATRHPEDYWREALRRDPDDARCNLALGRWHLRRGELASAERHLRTSIARLSSRNPNPADGEPFYQLGLCLRFQAFAAARLDPTKITEAYAAFYKATWNHAWQSAAFHALAEIDALRGEWSTALEHLERALRVNMDNLRARNLRVIALSRLGRDAEAKTSLQETLALDPLDWWARHLAGHLLTCDDQVRLDLALDHVRAGLFREALEFVDFDSAPVPVALDSSAAASVTVGSELARAQQRQRASLQKPSTFHERTPAASLGTKPLLRYYSAWIAHLLDDKSAERRHLVAATRAEPQYCFPARVEEITILEHAIARNPRDARAPFYLGNLLYDRRRHADAIVHWERAVKIEPRNAVAWRNLGIAYFNNLHDVARTRVAYERAFAAKPKDARLLYERDQLWKRIGEAPAKRLRELLRYPKLVTTRDDLSIELCALYNQTGRPSNALAIVSIRKFQPWEGGEGQALGQHVRSQLGLGRRALETRDADAAVTHFSTALSAPANLGEANHLLANQSDIHFWLGCALAANGDAAGAQRHWKSASEFKGDFQAMAVHAYSEKTYYSARSLEKLGRVAEAKRLLHQLLKYAQQLARTSATIDYFATSLPTMLLFEDDLQARQQTTAMFLEAQARLGLGEPATARRLLRTILHRDPNHALAADLWFEMKSPQTLRYKKHR